MVFLMHADMTAVTIQSNKTVSNEVKDGPSRAMLSKKTNFLSNPIFDKEVKLLSFSSTY